MAAGWAERRINYCLQTEALQVYCYASKNFSDYLDNKAFTAATLLEIVY